MKEQGNKLEDFFASNLGTSLEMEGATTWEQLQEKRDKKRAGYFTPRVVLLVGTIVTTLIAAAVFYPHELLFFLYENQRKEHLMQPAERSIIKYEIRSEEAQAEKINDLPIEQSSGAEVEAPINQQDYEIVSTEKTIRTVALQNEKLIATPNIENSASDSLIEEEEAPEEEDFVMNRPITTQKVIVVQKKQVLVKDTIVKIVKKKIRTRN